jgi:hypothetical protein
MIHFNYGSQPTSGGLRLVEPVVDERVQVERPQPRSGEDERPGRASAAAQ